MKCKITILLLGFLASSLQSQMILDTVYFDEGWEPTTAVTASYYRIISTDTSGKFRFRVHDYHLSGQLQMSGTYKSIRPDNKDGHFIYYYEDGIREMECHYHDNLLNGPYREWYPSGQKKVSRVFSDDVLDGPYTSWRDDGTLKVQTFYTGGKKNGSFFSYYENGVMARNELYEKDNLIEGQCFTREGEPTVYFPYIDMPRFPDGRTGLLRFIREELNYPVSARHKGYEGSVVILFTVDEEGRVRNPRVVNGDIQAFNTEALRIASVMPRWIPGKVDGIPSPMQVTIPIEFPLR